MTTTVALALRSAPHPAASIALAASALAGAPFYQRAAHALRTSGSLPSPVALYTLTNLRVQPERTPDPTPEGGNP